MHCLCVRLLMARWHISEIQHLRAQIRIIRCVTVINGLMTDVLLFDMKQK